MPVGGQVHLNGFDGSSKGDWLAADINGLLYTWLASLTVVIILLLLVSAITGPAIALQIGRAFQVIHSYLGDTATLICGLLVSKVPAFLIVFVFRKNFTVIGTPRKFRYIFRWL